jgi:raffinose/stachyose/melibiose transport system permease protein
MTDPGFESQADRVSQTPWLLRSGRSGMSPLTTFAFYGVLVFLSLVVVLPLLVTLFASFKTVQQGAVDFPLLPPSWPNPVNYVTAVEKGDIPLGFMNSMILVVVSVTVSALLTSMVAYCLSRFEFRLKRVYLLVLLLGMLMPTIVTEVARFGVIKTLGVYNTRMAPIILYSAIDMIQMYVYLQFMEKIPISIDESALIDGSSYFGVYFRIILPLTVPATATLAIIKTIEIMNDMFIPYLYMPSPKLHTLTTVLMYLNDDRGNMWTLLSAAIVLVMIPTVVLYLAFSRFIFKGIVAGAVKD